MYLFSAQVMAFLVTDPPSLLSSATVNLKPAPWFTDWVLVSHVVLTPSSRTIFKLLLFCGVQVKCEGVTMATAAASPRTIYKSLLFCGLQVKR